MITVRSAIADSAKTCTAVGAFVLAGYSVYLGHYPTGLGFGDAPLLLVASLMVGWVLLTAPLLALSLGALLVSALAEFLPYRLSSVPEHVQEFQKLKSYWPGTLAIALFSAISWEIHRFNSVEPHWYVTFPVGVLGAAALALLGCQYRGDRTRESAARSLGIELRNQTKASAFFGPAIAFIGAATPITSFDTSQTVERGLVIARIRVEKADIRVREPYFSLLPRPGSQFERISWSPPASPGQFSGTRTALVLWRGIGSSTVVQFPQDGSHVLYTIPNDSIAIHLRR